jgi:hypothetical protein
MSLLLTLLLGFGWTAAAEKTSYPAHKLSAQGIGELRITGVKGRLNLRHRAGGKHFYIKVKHSKGKRSEDWHLSMERHGQALVLEVFNTELGREWRRQIRKELWPEFDIEVDGPAKPTVVAWREGRLEIKGWNQPLEISYLGGSLLTQNTSGTLKIQAGESNVTIDDHQGPLELKGERGQVQLKKARGALNVHWVSGSVRADSCSGQVTLESSDADILVEGASGEWNVKLADGHARFGKFGGKLKAEGQGTEWEARLLAPSDAEISSKSGAVKLEWLSGGVKLFLSSMKGEIKVPKSMTVEERSGVRVVEAEKATKQPRGNVFVKTETGTIIWR